jgi:hypothetical protein
VNTSMIKSKIKWNLTQVSPREIEEINDFVESLFQKKQKSPKIVPLKGIWKGLGFEKIPDLDEEIKKNRKELEEQLSRRLDRWNT